MSWNLPIGIILGMLIAWLVLDRRRIGRRVGRAKRVLWRAVRDLRAVELEVREYYDDNATLQVDMATLDLEEKSHGKRKR